MDRKRYAVYRLLKTAAIIGLFISAESIVAMGLGYMEYAVLAAPLVIAAIFAGSILLVLALASVFRDIEDIKSTERGNVYKSPGLARARLVGSMPVIAVAAFFAANRYYGVWIGLLVAVGLCGYYWLVSTKAVIEPAEALAQLCDDLGLPTHGDPSPTSPDEFWAEGIYSGLRVQICKLVRKTGSASRGGDVHYEPYHAVSVEAPCRMLSMVVARSSRPRKLPGTFRQFAVLSGLTTYSTDPEVASVFLRANAVQVMKLIEWAQTLYLNLDFDHPYFGRAGVWTAVDDYPLAGQEKRIREVLDLLVALSKDTPRIDAVADRINVPHAPTEHR